MVVVGGGGLVVVGNPVFHSSKQGVWSRRRGRGDV